MKRIVLLIIIVVGVCSVLTAKDIDHPDNLDSEDAFSLQSRSDIKTIAVNRSINKETNLDLFSGIDAVYGLAVTMDVECLSDDFLVRILLEDAEGMQHLVAESYREIAADEKSRNYTNYCEETCLLDGVKPVRLQVYTHDANVQIGSVAISTEGTSQTRNKATFQVAVAKMKERQVLSKIKKINAYNEAHHKLWRAGETSLSLMDYETKKVVMGMHDESNLHGLEYYKGGIFEFGDAPETGSQGNAKKNMAKAPATNYDVPVTEFDWRNRHGHNWMTSVKNQNPTPYCVAFSIVGCMEAMTKLYYNDFTKMSDIDLSEQQLACCSFISEKPDSQQAVPYNQAFSYSINNGLMLESDYPFIPSDTVLQICHSSEKTPSDIVKIASSQDVSTQENVAKRKLIQHGPLVASLKQNDGWGHSMLLVGFGTITEGLNYYDFPYYSGDPLFDSNSHGTIGSGDVRIGSTYWTFKNSWGTNFGINGYCHVIFNSNPHYFGLSSLECPISTQHLTINDVRCSDDDGDGYYFWGGNVTPSSLPSWAPIYKDADDTDPTVGRLLDTSLQMEDIVPDHQSTTNLYGNLNSLGAFHFQYVHHHSSLQSGAVLQIDNRVNFYNGATLTLCNGSTLIVKEGGFLNNIILNIESGAIIRIEGGGQIKLAQGHSFSPPVGAEVNIENGSIYPFSE